MGFVSVFPTLIFLLFIFPKLNITYPSHPLDYKILPLLLNRLPKLCLLHKPHYPSAYFYKLDRMKTVNLLPITILEVTFHSR